jgi:signal transduction histidine kinase
LLSNALKFSQPGTRVDVRIRNLGSNAELAVSDQGPGLTADDQANLWERFTKLSARPTGGEQSTGLGLSIAKHLVETMGCTIQVESEPGKGATFRVKFPLARPEGDEKARRARG